MRILRDPKLRIKLFVNFGVMFTALWIFTLRDNVVKHSSPFDNLLIDFFASLQRGVKYIQSKTSNFVNDYVTNVSASKENRQLMSKILELEEQIFEKKEIVKENKRLQAFLELKKDDGFKRVLAQVVAWDSNSDRKVIRINKGNTNGIKIQSPVVTSQGLVGYIYRLTGHFADILTILDSNNKVDGMVQRTRSHGIIEGYSFSQLMMKYISRTEPVILKDTVITSGLGNIYPKGIKVGNITRIEKESYGITQKIAITPAVDFSRLEEVVVLVDSSDGRKRKEWKALNKLDDK
ncbi:MAG: rod shape-determining protein MreC [Halobacteriovoraceae bacterium]|nr:rod shape-determining protein MreC [Halobacteriovoraceae bacterium]